MLAPEKDRTFGGITLNEAVILPIAPIFITYVAFFKRLPVHFILLHYFPFLCFCPPDPL